jgi:NAD-dependent dihydropyrimidine dehydrogenase PreA subunit
MIREIVEIDEQKCDGCGQCIPSCAEGALYLEGGKVKLRADALCDGLGACLGECPQGALRVVKRDTVAFDEGAVAQHLAAHRPAAHAAPTPLRHAHHPLRAMARPGEGAGCPGSRSREFAPVNASPSPAPGRPRLSVVQAPADAGPPVVPEGGSRLGQWPVQISLVQPVAPWLRGADLLVAADCVPFAYARFHEDFLAGRRVLVGCPKLDDLSGYVSKLQELFGRAAPKSVTVVKMEVPCCSGIASAARQALARSGVKAPLEVVTIGLAGTVVNRA